MSTPPVIKISPEVPPAPPGVAKKVRVSHFQQMKAAGRAITVVTAYDAPMAALADAGSVDAILIGDSVGMVVHGMETTLPVTVEMMIMHTQAVARGSKRSLLITDLPFMSYQVSGEQALATAGRIMKEGGCSAVKLETASESIIPTVKAIVDAGIPVMGHIGLVPQSVHALGGYKVQGRSGDAAQKLIDQARRVQDAGAFAIVLELMAAEVAGRITEALEIPTIGIGAGALCDGQVLVLPDLLGVTQQPPRFVKKYMDARAGILRAIRKYTRDVRERTFPGPDHQFE
ncbi:3-methyl-2-oxobutanoate hydroxymethyltransferase [soil metagenome]